MKKESETEGILLFFPKRNQALLYLILAITCVTVLGVSLPVLKFLPGLPIPGTDASPEIIPTTVPVTSSNQISSLWILQIALSVGIVLIFILIITALLKRVNYKLVGALSGALALFFIFFSLLPQMPSNQSVTFPSGTTLPEHQLSEYQSAPIGDPPASLFFLVMVGFMLAGIILIGWLVVRVSRRNRNDNKLAAEAESAIQAIANGMNLGGVIIKCYLNMEKVVSQERGVDREQSMTPHEFETHLINKGIPMIPIQKLTILFEKARYGNQCLTEQDELDAKSSLSVIRNVCQSGIERSQ